MECQVQSDHSSCKTLTANFVSLILSSLRAAGVEDIVLCPSSRNAFFVQNLERNENFNCLSFFEERSAGFFALGNIKKTHRPAAVITTSGTAAAELLPALMEAHYLELPLIAVTADRPRRFRNSGAPQSAELVGIYSHYVSYSEDLDFYDEPSFLNQWNKRSPLHLNICLEDPYGALSQNTTQTPNWSLTEGLEESLLSDFLNDSQYPFAIVSGLSQNERTPVSHFLKRLNIPVYLESTSGLREDLSLNHLSIRNIDKLWKTASENNYPIDGILRIGGVPTLRPWRDLDDKEDKINTLSLTSSPFPGLHWGVCNTFDLEELDRVTVNPRPSILYADWQMIDHQQANKKLGLYRTYPNAEPSLIHQLSKLIPVYSLVYLGNSLPIREWDLAASFEAPHANIAANRGVCGIDGQLSTFFGMCGSLAPNWGIFGDLTALYDLSAPWALMLNKDITAQIVIINNGGGKIFERMYPEKIFQNNHSLNFKPFAEMWSLDYHLWHSIPDSYSSKRSSIIEIVPSNEQTQLFWAAL